MKGWKRAAACLLAAAVVTGMLALLPASADTAVFQMAVNDRFLEMNAATMPFRSEGIPYIPYTVFDRNVTGVRLGISSFITQTDTEYTLTIYSIGGTLRFDLLRGTCLDQNSGENLNMKAITRNGMVFVPMGAVCRYFGLSSDVTPTSYGTLLRVVNGQQTYDTNKFIEVATATGRLQERYNEYQRGQSAATSTPTPTPTPTSTLTVTPTPLPTETGDQPDRQGVSLYLAFQCTGGEGLASILDTLERNGCRGLFLFRPEDLTGQDSLLRRAVGSGHSIGLLVPGGSAEEALAALEDGSKQLEHLLRLRVHTVLAEGASARVREALQEAGWSCWVGNVDGLPDGRGSTTRGAAILEAAEDPRGSVRITLDDSTSSASVLTYLLPRLRREGYSIRQAVETEL